MPEHPAPSADFVRRCLAELASRGFSRVVTGALAPGEQPGFLAAGFEVHERLHLLAHDLDNLPPISAEVASLRRAKRRDRPDVLSVDGHAFPPFWRLDDRGLDEAIRATPRSRFRVAAPEHAIAGYAVIGRAGTRGYVQRLAVAPGVQRHGLGWALMVDGMHWLRRRGVERAVVNTQLGNDAALSLYERLGFTREAVGLSVLAAGLQ
jgi:ribosomal protein S18 acetylase RimI-like enzyme